TMIITEPLLRRRFLLGERDESDCLAMISTPRDAECFFYELRPGVSGVAARYSIAIAGGYGAPSTYSNHWPSGRCPAGSSILIRMRSIVGALSCQTQV